VIKFKSGIESLIAEVHRLLLFARPCGVEPEAVGAAISGTDAAQLCAPFGIGSHMAESILREAAGDLQVMAFVVLGC
jgi:hypothetical protein